jgi:hypothetical protein
MGKKTHWEHRALIDSQVRYGLFLSPKDFFKELKKMGLPDWDKEVFIPPSAGACVNFYEGEVSGYVAFVCLDQEKVEKENLTLNQVHALLLHEAVHIWQRIKICMNEKYPSKEFEAYSIQRIAQNLFYLYDDLIKK